MSQSSKIINSDDNQLKILVERIRRGKCILVLGPRVAVRTDDPERVPLDELLAIELSNKLESDKEESEDKCRNLRHIAELYYRQCNDPIELQLAAEEFYTNVQETSVTTPFHLDLAQLPFQLCICASPDDAMFQAFLKVNKIPQRAHYNFREDPHELIQKPSDKKPLVYYLFGHYQDSNSLVLTEGDLIDFLVAIIKGAPPIPDQVRSMFVDEQDTAFLFVGFGFQNWYLRVLLKIIGAYHHKSKQVAFEDTQFFSHPDCGEVIGFFSGERHIEFCHMQWEQFAKQMRNLYFAREPENSQVTPEKNNPSITMPLVFLSYASEDRESVDALANQLESRGLAIWQDKQNLRAGDDWSHVLVNVIEKRVDYFVVVQTPTMRKRVKGVFNEEIDVAIKQQKSMGEGNDGLQFLFLIPVTVGECNSFAKLEGWHTIEVSTEEGIDKLAKDIFNDWAKRQSQN